MNTKFKKLALSAGITAALAGFSLPSHAIIEGVAGEALLVPFVVYDSDANNNGTIINTIVELTVPGSVGLDTIPNNFTASHSTPTGASITFNNPNLSVHGGIVPVANSSIHWYFFDERSHHRLNGPIPVTADDFVQIDWGQIVRDNGGVQPGKGLNGEQGYLVFGTEIARTQGFLPGSHAAANFSFFGDAYLVATSANPALPTLIDAKIPVLPMNDGPDAPGQTKVTVDNQVLYKGNIVSDVSPLISGMRTVWSDGIFNIVGFDLTLGHRNIPTLQVFWNDHNGTGGLLAPRYVASVDVFDDDENECSASIPLDNELNTIWISQDSQFGLAPEWVNTTTQLCYPNGTQSALTKPGFVRYQIDEQGDTNINAPEQAAVAFSILWHEVTNVDAINNIVPVETALGHERGKFF